MSRLRVLAGDYTILFYSNLSKNLSKGLVYLILTDRIILMSQCFLYRTGWIRKVLFCFRLRN